MDGDALNNSAVDAPEAGDAVDTRSKKSRGNPTLVGSVGSFVEYFDFASYGFVAIWIGPLFFPQQNSTASLLSALAVFAVAYIARPIGGIVFGHFGDRMGRRNILLLTVLMMGFASALMGLLPTYATIGVAAPILLVLMRLIQGFSAGGELGGASAYVLETASPERRGRSCGFVGTGTIGGFVGGSLTVAIITALTTEEQMSAWGWRIPFLISLPITLLAIYVRMRWQESPEFEALKSEKKVARLPIRDALVREPLSVLKVIGVTIGQTTSVYIAFTFISIYFSKHLGYPATTAYWLVAIVGLLSIIGMPFAGALSDRFGRRPVLGAAMLALIIVSYPLFMLMDQGSLALACVAFVILLIPITVLLGSFYVTVAEALGTRVRYTGLSLGINVANVIAGGTAPLLAELLIARTGNIAAPALLLIGAAVIGLISTLSLKETARQPLKE